MVDFNFIAFDEIDEDILLADGEMIADIVISEPATIDDCFGLGMAYSAGAGVSIDLVTAHKWLNIAASRGHHEAQVARREIAEMMSDSEIGTAQRAARDWLKEHPLPMMAAMELRIAA